MPYDYVMNGLRQMLVMLMTAALVLSPIASGWAKAAHHSSPAALADCGKHNAVSGQVDSGGAQPLSTAQHVSEPSEATAEHAELAPSANSSTPAKSSVVDVCCDFTCTSADAVAEFAAAFPFVAKAATTRLSPLSVFGRVTGIDPPPPRVRAS